MTSSRGNCCRNEDHGQIGCQLVGVACCRHSTTKSQLCDVEHRHTGVSQDQVGSRRTHQYIFFSKIKNKKKNRGGRQPDRLRPFVRGSVYCSQNWTFVMPRKEGGRIAPHRDMSRARRDRHESSKLEHQIWVGGC